MIFVDERLSVYVDHLYVQYELALLVKGWDNEMLS